MDGRQKELHEELTKLAKDVKAGNYGKFDKTVGPDRNGRRKFLVKMDEITLLIFE